MFGGELGAMTYWTDRSDIQQLNWAGASAGYKGCPCGETGTCGNDGKSSDAHVEDMWNTWLYNNYFSSVNEGWTGVYDVFYFRGHDAAV